MKENKGAENALATIGAVMWMVQIVPQIIKSHRSKSTTGLSAGLMFIWALASLFLGAYLVTQRLSIPLQVQPQAFGVLSAVSTCQILYYSHNWSKKAVIWSFVVFCVVFAGFEAGSVYALWAGQDNGVDWPIQMYGYISAVLLAVALAPQYYEIWKFKEVLGISMMFLIVDTLGGVFSLASLFFRDKLDIAGLVSYALVVVLDSIVILLAIILNPLARRRRARAGVAPGAAGAAVAAGDTIASSQTEGKVSVNSENSAERGEVAVGVGSDSIEGTRTVVSDGAHPPTQTGDGMGEGLGKSVSREQEERSEP
ncbi:integral membrane protein [Kwoniella heveanensis CBS 569]|uniref:Integral membrane protein n=1 Tax=Kwoniella heveanensis BCC8398 TaxID=1296120 RepID=A0A1B9GWM8_9TREE|nr:integral membrane protein [Kwoniella heveanensis BCC8398]OCF41212.1 integral membrane protein [Kwoniella heveanensis CBS 569]